MNTYTISPKDTTDKIALEGVMYSWQEGNAFCFLFQNGSVRSYPMCNIWYVEKKETQ